MLYAFIIDITFISELRGMFFFPIVIRFQRSDSDTLYQELLIHEIQTHAEWQLILTHEILTHTK